MKMTTPESLLGCVRGECGEEIFIDDDISRKAKVCIDNMLRYGG